MCKTDVDPTPFLEDYLKGFMTYPEDQTRPHGVHGEITFIQIIHILFLRAPAPLGLCGSEEFIHVWSVGTKKPPGVSSPGAFPESL